MRMLYSPPRNGHLVWELLSIALLWAGVLVGLHVTTSARADEPASSFERRVFKGHTNTVFAVTCSPGGKILATARKDNR